MNRFSMNGLTVLFLLAGAFLISRLAVAEPEGARTAQIGVIVPLSGEFASWGEGVRRAIELWAQAKHGQCNFHCQRGSG